MKILFLSRWFPYPPNNGARLRIYHLLQGLAQFHEVHLVSFSDHPEVDAAAGPLTGCRSTRVVQWNEFQPTSPRAVLAFFSPLPRSLIDTYSKEMEREIRSAVSAHAFDLVITSQYQMTFYRRWFPEIPVLMEEIEVGVFYGQTIQKSPLGRKLGGLTWWKHRRYLQHALAGDQPCTVVSEQEKKLLSAIVPGNHCISVIPNGVSLDELAPVEGEPQPDTIIFTGSFRYKPNYHAMVWFVERVLPIIQAEIPGVRLAITGDHAGLPLPKNEAVTLTGFVDDVRPLIKRSWLSIAPLHEGGGTRVKILEAIGLGTPVVATTKGAEGLALTDGVNIEIADTPEEFAARTIRLLKDRCLRDRLAENMLALVREKYDWKVIMPEFLALAAKTIDAGRAKPRDLR